MAIERVVHSVYEDANCDVFLRVELRGGGTDESPFVYRRLKEMLRAHLDTV